MTVLTLEAALQALGIAPSDVLDSKVYEDRVNVITLNGKKHVWIPSETPAPVSAPEVDEYGYDERPVILPITLTRRKPNIKHK